MTFEEEVLLKRHHCIDKQKVKEVIDKFLEEEGYSYDDSEIIKLKKELGLN